MNLEIVILGEVRLRRGNISDIPYRWDLKGSGTNELTYRNRPTGFKNKLWLPVHTAVFKMESQQGSAVQPREVCSMLPGSLDGRAVWGRMDTCICIAESLHCSLETAITWLMSGLYPDTK